MKDCPRSRTESSDGNGDERGFSVPNIEGEKARELCDPTVIRSELEAAGLQAQPDGSSQAQRERLGRVCVRRRGPANQTRGRHQPANCITWGWLAWQVAPTPGLGPGGAPC